MMTKNWFSSEINTVTSSWHAYHDDTAQSLLRSVSSDNVHTGCINSYNNYLR